MSFRSRRRRNPSDIPINEAFAGKNWRSRSKFSHQTTFHCIVIGISPLALRNDMKHIYCRTQVVRFPSNIFLYFEQVNTNYFQNKLSYSRNVISSSLPPNPNFFASASNSSFELKVVFSAVLKLKIINSGPTA